MDEKIFVMNARKKGEDGHIVSRTGFEKGQTVSLKDFEKYYNLNVSLAIDSIKKNYLKNTATRAYIMDYPNSKLIPGKTGLYPKNVAIPSVLRTFITPEQVDEILAKWNEIYAEHPAIEKFGVVFK